MGDLDHFRISRILGSTVSPFTRRPFGGLDVSASTGTMLACRPKAIARLDRNDDRDARIVQAFSAVHLGYSVDRLLADPVLTRKFTDQCRKDGLTAPAAAINRRLLRIRKATDLPVVLPKATREDPRNLPPFLIAAELAFVQVTYRFGATVDDLLADPELGEFFDQLAMKIHPGGEAVDYRLAALHLRKNVRARASSDQNRLADIGEDELAEQWVIQGPMSRVPISEIPEEEGVFAVVEPNRYLFLTRHCSIREGVEEFRGRRVLEALGNRFWTPSVDRIGIQTIKQTPENQQRLRLLELKAIEVYHPIFNLPLKAA